jgi:hypothetical protein
VETRGNSFPSPSCCQIKMGNSVEDNRVREIHETRAEQQGRIEREVPQVGEVIDCIEDRLEVTEGITSHV